MTVNLAGGCRVSEMREGQPIANGSVRVWNQIGRATGAQAISLRVMEFGPGQSPGIQNGDCDEILYVLGPFGAESAEYNSQGQVPTQIGTPPLDKRIKNSHPEGARENEASITISIDGKRIEVDTGTGIYIRPRQVFAIDNHRENPVLVISSQCPEPDGETRLLNTQNSRSEVDHSGLSPIVRLADHPAQLTADRWYRVLVDDEIGSAQVTQFVGSIPPGRAPDHFHNYEEVLFILKGEGRMWAGETSAPISEGSCIYLPKGQVHCVENTGESELRLLGVFYPAGSPSVRYEVKANG